MTSPLLTDDSTAPLADQTRNTHAAERPDPSWLTRQEICAAHGLSLRALRRWRKDGLVERHCQDRQTFYRLTQTPAPPAPTAEPDTEQGWMDVIPIRTGRRQPEAPRHGEPARLASLLKIALEQRDAALEAQRLAATAQEALTGRLDGLQLRFDEALRQRDEIMQQRKRLQSERDELARKLTLAIRQRDAAIVARAEAVHRSDELACELNLANAERDKLTRRREALIARLDRTVQHKSACPQDKGSQPAS
jgi:hypothetical protein